MANRHKAYKKGGGVFLNEGSNRSRVVKEAQARKDGGKVCDMPVGKMAKRAHGGRVGADRSPMSPGVAKHPFSSARTK